MKPASSISSPESAMTSERRRIAPQPSSSMIAMQAKGLELPFIENSRFAQADDETIANTNEAPMIDTVHAARDSPRRCSSPSSSTYSKESVDSKYSGKSLETTISEIVEMYTNLIDKIPYDHSPSEVQIIQPKAYRDTVAPLLRRRFSSESVSVPPLISTVPASYEPSRKYALSLRSSYEQAPAFSAFSRNLRKQRAEAVSPCSVPGIGQSRYVSALPSCERPFSFVNDELDDIFHATNGRRSISPLSQVYDNAVRVLPEVLNCVEDTDHLDSAEPIVRLISSSPPLLRYIKHEDLQKKPMSPRPPKGQLQWQPSSSQTASERYYRKHSTSSDWSENEKTRSSLGQVVKLMVKDRIRRRQGSQLDQRSEVRAVTLPSTNPHVLDNTSVSDCQALEAITDLKLSEQKQEARVWFARSELSQGRKRLSERDTNESIHAPSPTRPKSYEHQQKLGHRRTSSSKTTSTVTSSQFTGRKHNLLTVLGGAKHSLTQTSAEKRREKLKESITVVGPTELTSANAVHDSRSLS